MSEELRVSEIMNAYYDLPVPPKVVVLNPKWIAKAKSYWGEGFEWDKFNDAEVRVDESEPNWRFE